MKAKLYIASFQLTDELRQCTIANSISNTKTEIQLIRCMLVIRLHVTSNKCIAVRKVATPLRELTCHMGSHNVTCHPTEVTFPPLPQPKLVLD